MLRLNSSQEDWLISRKDSIMNKLNSSGQRRILHQIWMKMLLFHPKRKEVEILKCPIKEIVLEKKAWNSTPQRITWRHILRKYRFRHLRRLVKLSLKPLNNGQTKQRLKINHKRKWMILNHANPLTENKDQLTVTWTQTWPTDRNRANTTNKLKKWSLWTVLASGRGLLTRTPGLRKWFNKTHQDQFYHHLTTDTILWPQTDLVVPGPLHWSIWTTIKSKTLTELNWSSRAPGQWGMQVPPRDQENSPWLKTTTTS